MEEAGKPPGWQQRNINYYYSTHLGLEQDGLRTRGAVDDSKDPRGVHGGEESDCPGREVIEKAHVVPPPVRPLLRQGPAAAGEENWACGKKGVSSSPSARRPGKIVLPQEVENGLDPAQLLHVGDGDQGIFPGSLHREVVVGTSPSGESAT